MKIFHLFVVLAMCCVSTLSSPVYSQQAKIVEAFDTASKGRDLPGKAPDYIYKEVLRLSPDGKYVARLTSREGEVGYVAVYRKRAGATHFLKRDMVMSEVVSVDGCVWVPTHNHWFAFSTSDSYGVPTIRLWKGGRKVQYLRRAKDGGFNIRGVSADGRTLVYEHFGPNSPDPNYKRNGRLTMRLPRS